MPLRGKQTGWNLTKRDDDISFIRDLLTTTRGYTLLIEQKKITRPRSWMRWLTRSTLLRSKED